MKWDWSELQQGSFYEATARQRAHGLMDEGTFRELAGPEHRLQSSHLRELGEAVSFDDGVVTGVGKIGQRPVFVISQEGRFIGGSVGETGGAKMVGIFRLALELYDTIISSGNTSEAVLPAVVISFETGGVRLQEANAGLLAHSEVMEQIQNCRGKVPVISLVGSKIGCFGGMGFVCVATDMVIMSELGRIGLTGPEVIEEVMGKGEFDSADKALIYRTTGGKHKYLQRDCAYLVEDRIGGFHHKLQEVLAMPYDQIAAHRSIGSLELVQEQLAVINRVLSAAPRDSVDVWRLWGSSNPESLPDLELEEFLSIGRRRPYITGS